MPLHNIAKSAVKPIFSPLPHPIFFVPKSPFFLPFPVSNPISGDFSRARTRFLPCEAHFFLVLPRFGSDFGRFYDGTSLFPAPNFNFSLLFPVFPHASGTSSRDLPLYYRHTSLFAQREGFSDSGFPFLHPLPHLPISINFLSASQSPHPLHLPPPLSFSFLPTFPSSSPITHERAHPRALRAYAYIRTHVHVRRFSFIAFTASPTSRNPLCTNALGVKENEKKPSPKAQSTHNQDINTKHPISSAVNFISSPR